MIIWVTYCSTLAILTLACQLKIDINTILKTHNERNMAEFLYDHEFVLVEITFNLWYYFFFSNHVFFDHAQSTYEFYAIDMCT